MSLHIFLMILRTGCIRHRSQKHEWLRRLPARVSEHDILEILDGFMPGRTLDARRGRLIDASVLPLAGRAAGRAAPRAAAPALCGRRRAAASALAGHGGRVLTARATPKKKKGNDVACSSPTSTVHLRFHKAQSRTRVVFQVSFFIFQHG